LKAMQPHIAPAFAYQSGVGGPRYITQHDSRPPCIGIKQAAILVVDVIVIAIDGCANSDDRFKCRRIHSGNLQRVKPAPGDTHHADVAVAPVLLCDPGNDFDAIGQFSGRIFVIKIATRFTSARYIYSDSSVTIAGKYGVGGFIAQSSTVALAIRQVLKDGRGAVAQGSFGQPRPG